MSQERISIDDLLAKQVAPAKLLATVEPTDAADIVKVTPFNAGGQCACDTALRIRKDAIDWVAPTGQFHECCGKQLMVVEVGIKDATLADVLAQLAANGRSRSTITPAQAQAYFQGQSPAFNNISWQAPRPMRTPGMGARPLGPVGIDTPQEDIYGAGDPNTCALQLRHCNYWCKFWNRTFPNSGAQCACNCQVDYWRCLDPNTFIPVDCNQM